MDSAQANNPEDGGMIPDDLHVQPQVTIRSQSPGPLVYDIDPNQLPTETITRGGRRLVLNDGGAPHEIRPEDRPHYEVIDKISEGGMGVVYNVQEKSLKREVALKICRAGIQTEPTSMHAQEVGEFANEAYMTAHLDHPGVVPIYALAKDADGRPFFAMKKVTGTSWKDLLHPDAVQNPDRRAAITARARQMTWKDHLGVLLKVCDAVAYAHSKAILHRDLKPENIMLGDYGEVYVMDWGLAIYFDERNEYQRFPDLKPQLAGTPSYIAPEMARGKMTALCPATDIYLLGGILYEIMTGRPPHDGTTVMDVLKSAATGAVALPPDSGDSPLQTRALCRIVMKALAPEIADRYASVADFQQALRGYLANSESMAVHHRAAAQLAAIQQEFPGGTGDTPSARGPVDKDAAAIAYGQLSECVGGFRQAIELWTGNREARRGLLDALALQIQLAIRQGDLTLARAQFRLLDTLRADASDLALAESIAECSEQLATQIAVRQARLDRATRQTRGWKIAAIALSLLLFGGLAALVASSFVQRTIAIRNEKVMFAESVLGRAQMFDQFLFGIEQIATLYRQTAVELMSSPVEHLPWSKPTPAGRDGYYYDEDFYDPGTRPPGLEFSPRYQTNISLAFPTLVRAPWARDKAHRPAVEEAAARLGRMKSLFAHIHRTRRDIQWSIAGSEAGLLVGFPGFGRYRDKPEYDPTLRTWYKTAFAAPTDRPVWGAPYPDASTRLILMSCMCRIHIDGRTIGAIGLEITLENIQKMLLDFSQSLGGQHRALLVRPFQEHDSVTGQARTVHRVVVDTRHPRTAADWKENLPMAAIEDTGPEIAAYYRQILTDQPPPGICHETGKLWMTYAPFQGRNWILLSILERGR